MSSYAALTDVERFLENFATNYYGSYDATGSLIGIGTAQLLDDLNYSYNTINTMLKTIARIPIVPIGTQSTGSYHPSLVEWNACDVIYRKLKSRHSYEYNGQLPAWMMEFGSRGFAIYGDVASEKISFDFDTTTSGIGFPVIITGTGKAVLYSNWDSGYYQGYDFPKKFRIKIDGTTDGNDIGQSTFKVSEDGGVSWPTTLQETGTAWITVADGFAIRWAPYANIGTLVQLNYGDEWEVTCTPQNLKRISGVSSFRTFGRG